MRSSLQFAFGLPQFTSFPSSLVDFSSRSSQFRLQLWIGVGVVSLLGSTLVPGKSLAQRPVADTTLPSNSIVTPIDPFTDQIDGGTDRGANLFHSFFEFNIGEGHTVNFTNPVGIERIFSRVTGGDRSDILGRLGVIGDGNADLFLINPNGIIFGPNFDLDVNGSFIISTADAIGFESGGFFSATDPTNSVLLSVNPNAFFFGDRPNSSDSKIHLDFSANQRAERLIPEGETFGFVGGDVYLDGVWLSAPDGRFELGAVGGNSTVNIIPLPQGYDFDYDGVTNFEDVELRNRARLNASGEQGGNVHLEGARVLIDRNVIIASNTEGNSTAVAPRTLFIRASERLSLNDGKLFSNVLESSTSNQTGVDIVIDAPQLVIERNGQIISSVRGTGQGGNIIIQSADIDIRGNPFGSKHSHIASFIESGASGTGGSITIGSVDNLPSNEHRFVLRDLGFIDSTVANGAQGTAGDITIQGGMIDIRNDAEINGFVESGGQGSAGNITLRGTRIEVTDDAEVNGGSGEGIPPTITLEASESVLLQGAEVKATLLPNFAPEQVGANIVIDSPQIDIRNSAQLRTLVLGNGDGGDIQLTSTHITLDANPNGNGQSSIAAAIAPGGSGSSGDITIDTARLDVANRSRIATTIIQGEGQSGDITVRASEYVKVKDPRSVITTDVFGGFVDPGDVGARGETGDLTIETPLLELTNQGRVSTSIVRGAVGQAGDIIIRAGEVIITSPNVPERTGILTQVNSNAAQGESAAGNIDIVVEHLVVEDGGVVSSFLGQDGQAGNIVIRANAIEVSGLSEGKVNNNGIPDLSAIIASVGPRADGVAGDIQIDTDQLTLNNGGQILSQTGGPGTPGNITIRANSIEIMGDGGIPDNDNDASALSVSTDGLSDAGDILVEANTLSIRDQGRITARAIRISGDGNTGAPGELELRVGTLTLNGGIISTSVEEGVTIQNNPDQVGQIVIDADTLVLSNASEIGASTSGVGNAGDIRITIDGDIELSNNSQITSEVAAQGMGDGGDIGVRGDRLTVASGSQISSSTSGLGDAGDISVAITNDIDVTETGSGIFASVSPTAQGEGGDISVEGDRLALMDGSQISAETDGQGRAGNITLTIHDHLMARGENTGILANTASDSSGGSITIHVPTLLELSNGATISASTTGRGRGGSVAIDSGTLSLRDQSRISASTNGDGAGGSVNVMGDRLTLSEGGIIEATTIARGAAGNIQLAITDDVTASGLGSGISTSSSGLSDGGDITLTSDRLSFDNSARIAASTGADGSGRGGNVILTTEEIALANEASIAASTQGAGQGGQIQVDSDRLFLTRGASIAATTTAAGDAGEINLTIRDRLEAVGDNTRISVSTSAGSTGVGGGITVRRPNHVALSDRAEVSASTEGTGNSGSISVESGRVSLNHSASITANTSAAGDGGNISLDSHQVDLNSGGAITANTSGAGMGGDITIESDRLDLNGGELSAQTTGAGSGGNITLSEGTRLTNLSLTNESRISASSTGLGDGGDIRFESDAIVLNNSRIEATTGDAGSGAGGNITLSTGALSLEHQASIAASTEGEGRGGQIDIHGPQVSLAHQSSVSAQTSGAGAGGEIDINSDRLAVSGGSEIEASTTAAGNAGNINLTIRDQLMATGDGTAILVSTEEGATGQGGGITLNESNQLTLTDGAIISASTAGTGNSGSIAIDSEQVTINSGATIAANTSAGGDGGDITIESDRLDLNGGELSAQTTGTGSGGNIALSEGARLTNLSLTNESRISASSTGLGDGGDIRFESDRIFLNNSQITATTGNAGHGTGGNIILTTDTLSLNDQGEITASTRGAGDGGLIDIEGTRTTLRDQSRISARTTGAGDGGRIQVAADTLSVTRESGIEASTTDQGNAGSITLDVQGQVTITGDGSEISVSTKPGSTGSGGDITLSNTDQLTLEDGGSLSANTAGAGRGGSITLDSDEVSVTSGASITAITRASGAGGSIEFNSDRISLDNGAISARTTGTGQGGNITVPRSRQLSLNNGARITANSDGTGGGGNINLNSDRITLNNASDITASTGNEGRGRGGDITLTTSRLSLDHGSEIAASTSGGGRGGEITIDGGEQVTLNNASDIAARTSGVGQGGRISLTSEYLSLAGGANITANAADSGDAGDIKINVEGEIRLAGMETGIFASTEEGSTGEGGNINVDPRVVRIEDGASIATDSLGTGTGGDITLESGRLFLVNGVISAETSTARGGNLALNIGDLLLLSENSVISATAGEAQGAGDGGNIMINVADGYVIALDQTNNDIVANAFAGNGGEITINANQIINLAPRLSQPENRTNDIDASSEFGSSGTITINGINVDPTRGLTALPTQIVDAARLVAQECAAGVIAQNQSEFTIVGQGGLIPEPGHNLSQAIWDDTRIPMQRSVAITPSEQPQSLIPSNMPGDMSGRRSLSLSHGRTSQRIIPSAQFQPLIPTTITTHSTSTAATHTTADPYPVDVTQVATTDNNARIRSEAQGWLRDNAENVMLLTELTAMMSPTSKRWQPNPTCGIQ